MSFRAHPITGWICGCSWPQRSCSILFVTTWPFTIALIYRSWLSAVCLSSLGRMQACRPRVRAYGNFGNFLSRFHTWLAYRVLYKSSCRRAEYQRVFKFLSFTEGRGERSKGGLGERLNSLLREYESTLERITTSSDAIAPSQDNTIWAV